MYRIILKIAVLIFVVVFSSFSFAQDKIAVINVDSTEITMVSGVRISRHMGNIHLFNADRNMHIYCDTAENYRGENLYLLKSNVKIEDDEKILMSEKIRYNTLSEKAVSPGPFIFEQLETGMILTGNTGTYDMKTENLVARENVVYKDSTRTLFCDIGKYDVNTDKFVARENVIYEDSIRTFYSDIAEYDKISGEVSAFENIRFYDLESNVFAVADTGKFFQNEEYGIMSGNPIAAIADSASDDSLYISGNIIEFFKEDSAKVIISDNVNIQKGNMTAYSQRAVYDKLNSFVYLREKPEIIQDSLYISGDLIDLKLEDQKLTEVIVRENASALYNADSTGFSDLKNKLTGKTITIFIKDNVIDRVEADMSAEMIYHSFDENNKFLSTYLMTSGIIELLFKDGQIINIKGFPEVNTYSIIKKN
ncbi:OstA-like protein [candidate division KSB1 bacterium]